jgi:O-antigen ligase
LRPKASRQPTLHRVARFCFLLLIVALPWTIAPMSITAVMCAAATVPIWIGERDRTPFRNPVTIAALAWLAALVLSAAFGLNPSASWSRLGKGLFPALVALASWHVSTPERGRRMIGALFVSASAAWIYGLVVFVKHGASFAARARGAVGHYMTFAGQISLVVCLATGLALALSGRARLASFAIAVLGTVALAATYTRSAWLGMFVAFAVMLAFARPRWLVGLATLAVVVYLVAPGAYHARLASIFDPHHPSNVERTYMWGAGLRMFEDHPLTGVGLEDLKPIYDRYRPPEAHERAGHLHSVPVQIAATMGVIGLVAFVLLYTGLVRCAVTGIRTTLESARSARARGMPGDAAFAAGVRIGVLGALAGFLVAGMFEWNFGDEELLHPLYLLAGLAWAARRWNDDPAAGRMEERPR